MRRGSLVCALGAMAVFGATAHVPRTAEACGGTFCDGGGPTPMPVDQSGENILFVRDNGFTEAHIQIQYEGEAQNFAWVIPLLAVPEFSVGSEPLFQSLLNGSVPTYTVNQQFDDCGPVNGSGLTGAAPDGDGAAGEDGGDAGEDPGGGPQVVLQETVGAYEIAVLEGGTAAEVIEWLDANGYAQDPEAEPILRAYLDEGFLFGAVKLTGGADVDEIHPIVLRMATDEACIPLRLTRIAALDDMDVRSFFLGDARTVPQNYRHVLINQVKIDWTPGNLAQNYKQIISEAVDAPMASGRAFVTEYAGTSDVVPRGGFYSESWRSQPFETIQTINVIDELTSQGLFFCDFDFGSGCAASHPLIQPLLDEYLPVPAGVDPNEFYACVSCYEDQLVPGAWDGPAFAAAMEQRVVEPGKHANQILDDNPYLTRLYTTISPGEMTEDPLFHENRELPDVTATLTGTQRILCNGDSVYILPDGRQVYLPAGAPWPDFDTEPSWSMPSDEEVQEVMAAGAPVVLANNTEAIDDALEAYNAAQGWAGGGAADGGGGGEGSSGGGCGCRTSGGGMAGLMTLLLGLGLGVASRRRSRR